MKSYSKDVLRFISLGIVGLSISAQLPAQNISPTPSKLRFLSEAEPLPSAAPASASPSVTNATATSDETPAESRTPTGSSNLSSSAGNKLGSKALLIQQIDVLAHSSQVAMYPDDGVSLKVDSREVSFAAGAYNDIPKFLQTLPGVAFDTDARNTYLVNGGNAMENLYVLDGVEIPNINHISTSGSSGGFVSIVDTDVVSSLTLHKQLYGSQYSGSLSSVLDINTVVPEVDTRHGEISVGYAGAGFLLEQPLGRRGETMTQFRHSIVNYMTNDIGIDGVPKYVSLLSTSNFSLNNNDSVRSLFLWGGDTLDIRPNVHDSQDPGLLNTNYRGNRSTGAVTWHHDASAGANDLQFNYSNVSTNTLQTDPYKGNSAIYGDRLVETPVTIRYDMFRQYKRVGFQIGSTAGIRGLNYRIDQASGYPSPYSLDPTPVDASNIATSMSPRNYAFYGEGDARILGPVHLQGGLRYEHWGINNSSAWMPRIGLKLPLTSRSFVFGGVGSYSQMPSLPVMLGVAQNIALKPIRDVQTQAGIAFADAAGDQIEVSIYGRRYSSYPVSTEFQSLSLADVVDPFGQPYLYMPMTSAGKGTVSGAELVIGTSLKRRAFLKANVTSQAVIHQALDGVPRRASYDMPVLANVLGGIHITRRQLITARYSFHTGTPFTPFLLPESQQQQREIYDLTQIDTQRGSSYARADLRYEINLPISDRRWKIYVGVENLMNRSNFYQYVLLPQCYECGPYPLTQMGRYADGGAVWNF